MSRPLVAIADDPRSIHGCAMACCASVMVPGIAIAWLDLDPGLPELLHRAVREVNPGAVALPLRVRGGGVGDAFTEAMIEAIRSLTRQGVPVFVADGVPPNPLAAAGLGTAPSGGRAALCFGPPDLGASGACVRAASVAAALRVAAPSPLPAHPELLPWPVPSTS